MSHSAEESNTSVQSDPPEKLEASTRIPLWVSIVVVLGALLLLSGAVISKVVPTMLTNGSSMTEAARVYADYTFARNLPLVLMLLFLLAIQARRMLAGFMVLIAFIQILDIINDMGRGAFVLVPGLLLFALVFLLGAWNLFGQAIWHITVWRE